MLSRSSSKFVDAQFRPQPAEAVICHRAVGGSGPRRPVFHRFEPVGDFDPSAVRSGCIQRRFASKYGNWLIEHVAIVPVQVFMDDGATVLLGDIMKAENPNLPGLVSLPGERRTGGFPFNRRKP